MLRSVKGSEIKEDLRNLGGTAPEIADRLDDLGIKGVPIKAQSCPVAEYLKWLGYKSVTVGPSSVGVNKRRWSLQRVMITTPEPIRDFMGNFDMRRYPTLLK